MKIRFVILAVVGVLASAAITHGFTFLIPNATIDRLGGDNFRLRILVNCNLELKYSPDGWPSQGAFSGFSLGPWLGDSQDNFLPWSDTHGMEIWNSDGGWRTGHLGFYPLSLPRHLTRPGYIRRWSTGRRTGSKKPIT